MMTNHNFLTSYQRIEGNEEFERDDELSTESLIRVVPKAENTRWNHIEDLDSFFTRIYNYHQESGLFCMILQWIGDIVKFLFVAFITTFVFTFVNYNYLFKYELPDHYKTTQKVFLSDCVFSLSEAWENISAFSIFLILMSLIYFIFKMFVLVINYFHFKDIQRFYNVALGYSDDDLGNLTWEEVQQRLMEVQIEQRMCIHKESLTELDIYHRILRFENYFIAMVNKDLFPFRVNLPFIGEYTFLSRGLRQCIDFLLFSGIGAPFRNWHLQEEYKRYENRHQLAEALNKRILYMGILLFALSPFVVLYQLLRSFYHYTSKVRNNPNILGIRRWSYFGQTSLRHYNELPHELQARLNRAYEFATKYLNCFNVPVIVILAQNIGFIFGGAFTILMAFTMYDEDVIQVTHIITMISVSGFVTGVAYSLLPDLNKITEPELELSRVLSEVHYLPDNWKGKAHTKYVQKEFSYYFQYKLYHVFESSLSPLLTPYILCFRLRHKSLAIIDFLRNFTVEVTGVGDICSFAQMDIRKHGSLTWDPRADDTVINNSIPQPDMFQNDNGRTELSLLHFSVMNPRWKPPKEATEYLNAVRARARREFCDHPLIQSPLMNSIASISMGCSQPNIVDNLIRSAYLHENDGPRHLRGRLNCMEGSRHVLSNGILGSISEMMVEQRIASSNSLLGSHRVYGRDSFAPFMFSLRAQEITPMDMNASALYLHGLHRRQRAANNYTDAVNLRIDHHTTDINSRRDLQPSTYLESYYNSSDPPSVEESYNCDEQDGEKNLSSSNEQVSSSHINLESNNESHNKEI